MKNPFKFGSVVDNNFFTNRTKEITLVKQILNSHNHLILISPRRYGKTSLICKVLSEVKQKHIFLNMQLVTDIESFAQQLLKQVLEINKWENIKHRIANFRIIPTITTDQMTGNVDISFNTTVKNDFIQLEDVLNLIDKISSEDNRTVVVLDEFQEIGNIQKNLYKQLRSITQHHKNINYIFMGSVESMMREIFENKQQPFYHFGTVLTLGKIPYNDFFEYLVSGFKSICGQYEVVAKEILSFTDCHPYYTQQMSFYYWNFLEDNSYSATTQSQVIENVISLHNIDFERLWGSLKIMEKKILIAIAKNVDRQVSLEQMLPHTPTSTIYSAIKKMIVKGYVVKDNGYSLEDPFFQKWIISQTQ
jgi:hypothetical protein